MTKPKPTKSLRKNKKGGIVLKNYDNLVLMHYGVKGMKWRHHKINGSNSLYEKRRAQMRYSSSSNRPNGEAESTRKPFSRDEVGPNGNPENTRNRMLKERTDNLRKQAVADRLKSSGRKALDNAVPKKKKKPNPIDSITNPKPTSIEGFIREPGRKLKKKGIEYDTNGSKYDPAKAKAKAKARADKDRVDNFFKNARQRYDDNREGTGKNGEWTYDDAKRYGRSRYAGPKKKKKKSS